jgi:formylglycine-generating enzyme required for sulfatase activity
MGIAWRKNGTAVSGGAGPGMVFVKGGTLPVGSELAGQVVGDFQIGKYEVTWGEWKKVRDWAVTKGYDLAGVGGGSGEDHPVRDVSWHDAVRWCNARSEMEGKAPVYSLEGVTYRGGVQGGEGSAAVVMGEAMNGYRLPREAEWEWAARGGLNTNGYTYSGGNDWAAVGWYWDNSSGNLSVVPIFDGRGTSTVGRKLANELGLYDMSGNVLEFCWDSPQNYRRMRGAAGTRVGLPSRKDLVIT